LLADFAREQLGENSIPFVDVALYYQQFAERNRTNYPALRPEWENLMAGMQVAHQLSQWPLVISYAEALTQAWFTRARYGQARLGYTLASEAAKAAGDEHAVASALLHGGKAALEQNDYQEASQQLRESVRLYQQLEDESGVADAQYYLGRIAIEQGDFDQAAALLASSQQLREQLQDAARVAAVLYQEAFLFYRRSDLTQAKVLCERALAIQEPLADQAGLLPTLRLLADIALEQEEHDVAEMHLRRCLTLCMSLQDRGELAATYYSLAIVAINHNKLDQAQTYVANALELSQWMGNRQFQAMALYGQCWIHAKRAEFAQAIEVGQKSLAAFRELQDNFNLVYVLCYLGDFYLDSHQPDQAKALWQEAHTLAQKLNHPLLTALHDRFAG
jgi:tetratricopeptide (TPR) repeat protein